MIIGYLDKVENNVVKGWAFDFKNDESVRVNVYVNGKLNNTGLANFYRKALIVKRIHHNGYCEFNIPLKLDKEIGEEIKVDVKALSAGIEETLQNSPISYSPTSQRPILFLHIAKTGGTSFNKYMQSILGPENCHTHVEGVKDWSRQNRNLIQRNNSFISGHLTYHRLKSLFEIGNHWKFAIIREPVSHLISHLNWVRNISDDIKSSFFNNHSDEIKETSLKIRSMDLNNSKNIIKFLSHLTESERVLFHNCQARYFLENNRKNSLDQNDFNAIQETIKDFDLIGTTDNMNYFFEEVARLLILPKKEKAKKLNKSKNKYIDIDLSNKKINDFIHEYLFLDFALYNFITHNQINS